MERYALELSFDGTNYCGWQKQENSATVQATLDDCLSKILGLPTFVMGCGRTDSGVHAKNFIAHFDAPLVPKELLHKLNKLLPNDIGVHKIYIVPLSFHARFDALERTYLYRIAQNKTVFNRDFSFWDKRIYDVDLMNIACEIIVQTGEFGAFSKKMDDMKTNVCSVRKANWSISEEGILFEITADRFLRNMVRSLVGTMLELGRNRINLDDFKGIVASQKRTNAGPSAPAQGLILTEVVYDRAAWQELL